MSYVYAVKLQSDKYYVGETSDYKIYEKMKMKSLWTTKYKPVQPLVIYDMTNNDFINKFYLTLVCMKRYGIDNVRGGPYCSVELTPEIIRNIGFFMTCFNGSNDFTPAIKQEIENVRMISEEIYRVTSSRNIPYKDLMEKLPEVKAVMTTKGCLYEQVHINRAVIDVIETFHMIRPRHRSQGGYMHIIDGQQILLPYPSEETRLQIEENRRIRERQEQNDRHMQMNRQSFPIQQHVRTMIRVNRYDEDNDEVGFILMTPEEFLSTVDYDDSDDDSPPRCIRPVPPVKETKYIKCPTCRDHFSFTNNDIIRGIETICCVCMDQKANVLCTACRTITICFDCGEKIDSKS